jgi:hypothetical protein
VSDILIILAMTSLLITQGVASSLLHVRYPYFDVVLGLAWSDDPESHARGSVPTGRVSFAGEVKGDD